jgi:hypothetical protein
MTGVKKVGDLICCCGTGKDITICHKCSPLERKLYGTVGFGPGSAKNTNAPKAVVSLPGHVAISA